MENKQHIVILHGWESNPSRWEKVRREIEGQDDKHKVHIPHLPGFDEKNLLTRPYTIEDYTHWLDSFIRQNKIDRPVLVGHSNGGRIASYYTARYPDSVSKLILIGAAGIPPRNTTKKAVFKLLSLVGRMITKTFPSDNLNSLAQKALYKLARESDYLRASPVMKKTMQNVLSYDATDDLKKIKNPTLVIWGRDDTLTPLWMGESMRIHIKKSKLKILEGSHNLHITHPHDLAQLIVNFARK